MKIFNRYLVTAFLCCALFILFSAEAHCAWQWPKRQTKSAAAKRKTTRHNQRKKYKYMKSHDYNHDGKVDSRDRLMWLNKKGKNYETAYVSTENEDIVEVMDMDEDGDVESWEMQQFYGQYDMNGNGILEDAEIEAAAD